MCLHGLWAFRCSGYQLPSCATYITQYFLRPCLDYQLMYLQTNPHTPASKQLRSTHMRDVCILCVLRHQLLVNTCCTSSFIVIYADPNATHAVHKLLHFYFYSHRYITDLDIDIVASQQVYNYDGPLRHIYHNIIVDQN